MDDIVLKVAQQGGPVTVVVVVIAVLIVRYIGPLLREALAVHKEDLAKVLAQGTAANEAVIKAFETEQARQERQIERLIGVVLDKLGTDLAGMRKDLDKVVITLDGLRGDLSGRVAPKGQ
jgi:hypothetical protein